jgi:sugar lactone lactonase YvrE
MKASTNGLLLMSALVCCGRINAQLYETNNVTVQTFVGSGFYGWVDGQGMLTMFNNPSAIATDSSSNFFVLDSSNYRVRKVTPDGTVTTFIGGGQYGPPGYGTNVSLQNYSFGGMAIDHSDVLWLTTGYLSGLLRITMDGLVQPVSLPTVSQPSGVCVDSRNNLYVSDSSGNKIYRFRTNWVLEVFAGSGNLGSVDGNGIFTSFSNPTALAVDAADNIYVWDSSSHLLRRINQDRDVVTIAGILSNYSSTDTDGVGTNASFSSVAGMVVDHSGNLILSCGNGGYYGYGSSIRKLGAGTNVTTIAGSFTQSGYANGPGSNALFNGVSGVCVSQDKIFVADGYNQRIRSLSFDPAPQLVPDSALSLNTFAGLQITGAVGRTYRIESSTTMSNWVPEATILLSSSPYLWIDPNTVGPKNFYRAFLLP